MEVRLHFLTCRTFCKNLQIGLCVEMLKAGEPEISCVDLGRGEITARVADRTPF